MMLFARETMRIGRRKGPFLANAVNEVDSGREEEEREEWREDGRESEEREDTKTINNQNNKPPEPVYCTATHDTLPTLNPKPSGSSVKTLHPTKQYTASEAAHPSAHPHSRIQTNTTGTRCMMRCVIDVISVCAHAHVRERRDCYP